MRTILAGLVLACTLAVVVKADGFGQDMLCKTAGTGTACASCYDGAYLGADGRCAPCTDPLCLQCTHNGACDVSTNVQYVNGARYQPSQYPSPGPYVETDNTGMPELLPDQCMVTEGSACSTCGRGYYSNGVSCSPCAAHCDVCTGSGASHCTVAEPGWSLNGGSAFVPCDNAGCYECDLSDSSQCHVCNDPRGTPTNCVASLHYGCYDATNPSGTCNACAFPYYGYSPGNSDNHKCTVCPPGCAACSDSGDGVMSCDLCVDGWDTITDSNGVATCGVCSTTNCSQCEYGGAHNTESCTLCDEFSNLNGDGECDTVWGSCPPGCIECDTTSGYCTGGDGCRDGYAPKQTPTNDNAQLVYQCAKVNHCIFYNQSPGLTGLGISNTKNFIAAECNACEPGYGLSSSFAEGNGGFYFNARTQCDSCDNVAGMTPAQSCGTCHREYNANGAWGPVAMVCDGCKPGFYLETPTKCTACPDQNCLTCDRAHTCLLCAPGYKLNDASSMPVCIPCTSSLAAECRQNGIAGCDDVEIIVRCIDGYGLTTDGTAACAPCTNGGGADPTAQPHCLACIGTQDENAFRCGRCNITAGYYVTDDGTGCKFCVEGCRDCYDADNCAVCEPPRYASMSGASCTDCNLDNCAQCQNATACKTCDDTYKLWNGICVLAECGVANCSVCATATTCETCDTGLTLSADGKTCGCGVENCDYCGGANQCNVCKSGFAPNTDGTMCVASTSTSSTTNNGGSGPTGTTGDSTTGGDGDSSNAAIVTGDSGDNSSTGGLSNGGIVGVVVGVAAFVLLVLIGGWVYVKYRASRAAKQAQQNAGGASGSEEAGSQDLSRSNESGSEDATSKKGSKKGSAASGKKAPTGSKKDAGSASKKASGTGSQKKASAGTKGSKKDAGSAKKGTKKVVEISGSAELESMSADQLSGSAE